MAIYPIKIVTEKDLDNIRKDLGDIPQPLLDKDKYTTLVPTQNIYENGNALLNAYFANENKYEYTIFLLPGVYDLSGRNLSIFGNVRIIGLGEDSSLVKIQSAFSGKGEGVINEKNNRVHLQNLSVQNSFTGVNNYWLQPTQSLENHMIGNVQFNRHYGRSSFSSSTNLVFSSGFADQGAIMFNQIYFYDTELNEYRIAFKEKLLTSGDSCRYIIQSKPSETEEAILDLYDYNTESFPNNLTGLYKIGIWKLVSGTLSGDRLTIDSVLALENPELNSSYNSSQASLKYKIKSWPWLVNDWRSYSNGQALMRKASVVRKESYIKNVQFLRGAQSVSMNAPAYYGGEYIDCEASECSFGGNGGYLEGNFINCSGAEHSFSPQYYREGSLAINDFYIENSFSKSYGLGFNGELGKGKMNGCSAGDRSYGIQASEIGRLGPETIISNFTRYGGTGFNIL